MNQNNLFRVEVLNSKRIAYYGTVLVNTPANYLLITLAVVSIAIFIVLFFIFAEFSEKFMVRGYVNSAAGIALVYPTRNGVIIKSNVQHNKYVKKGEELFVIDTSYDVLDKHGHHGLLRQLEKRKHAIKQDLIEKEHQLLALNPLLLKKYISITTYNEKKQEITALKNNLNTVEMDIIKYNQQSYFSVHSPINGTIASIHYKKGQYTNLAKPLIKILPAHTDLVVELFVPANQAGFLAKDNKIIVRYDAYPYVRFGSYQAIIDDISQSILTDQEEDKPLRIGQPYYKVTAHLTQQVVTLYGKTRKLQHGMTLTAVVVGDKRKLWRWILDPLLSYYGELML